MLLQSASTQAEHLWPKAAAKSSSIGSTTIDTLNEFRMWLFCIAGYPDTLALLLPAALIAKDHKNFNPEKYIGRERDKYHTKLTKYSNGNRISIWILIRNLGISGIHMVSCFSAAFKWNILNSKRQHPVGPGRIKKKKKPFVIWA